MVLPPRVRREPDGRRVRRRDADGLRPNLPGRRAALRRWEDLARPRGWHRVRGVPGFAPDSANQPLRTEFHVVVRIIRGGTRGLRGPRHRRAPGGPNRRVPQTADAQAPRCKSPVLDQYDFVVGALMLSLAIPAWSIPRFFSGDALLGLLVIILITPALHRAVNVIGFRIGQKREPW